MKNTLRLAVLAAGLFYFFDPKRGKRRRKNAIKKLNAFAGRARGAAERATHPKEQPDDVTLVRKVESELFRDAEVPKGKININAENGKIVLRGEADSPGMIDDLAKKAKSVQGVQDVENLLHVPGEPAPSRAS
jgi:osmotically-inducible protein OsmY